MNDQISEQMAEANALVVETPKAVKAIQSAADVGKEVLEGTAEAAPEETVH